MNSGDTTERKKQKLIDLGKSKGFLTYDEVNDNMPEDIVSSDQIDDWLSALGDEGIEIVDSASKVRVSSKVPTPKVADAIEEDEKEEETEDEDYDSGYSKTNDPVRMYLRKMGSVSLLTREGEVEIAKRIEEGERRVLQTVLNSPIAVEELLLLGERLKKQKVRVKEVIRDVDEEDAEFDEEWHTERVCKVLDKVRRFFNDNKKHLERLDAEKGLAESKKKKIFEAINANKQEMFEELSELRLNKKTIERIVAKLKNLVVRIEKAEAEVGECERRAGMPLKDLRKTLRELKSAPAKAKTITKKLGVTAAEFEEMERIMKSAAKMVEAVEEEAKIRVEDLRDTYREIHEGERRSEEHTSELQSQSNLVCRLLLEKK